MNMPDDYLAWTRHQAAELRRLQALRMNLPVDLDLDRLAEEVEDLGNQALDVVEGLLVQVILHLLKLEWSTDPLPRAHWRKELKAHRSRLDRLFRRSPSLVHHLDLAALYKDARQQARDILLVDLPDGPPYGLEELRNPAFFPANRYRPDTEPTA